MSGLTEAMGQLPADQLQPHHLVPLLAWLCDECLDTPAMHELLDTRLEAAQEARKGLREAAAEDRRKITVRPCTSAFSPKISPLDPRLQTAPSLRCALYCAWKALRAKPRVHIYMLYSLDKVACSHGLSCLHVDHAVPCSRCACVCMVHGFNGVRSNWPQENCVRLLCIQLQRC